MATVLFVSKPIAPPFHDGTKCVVRDLAANLARHRAAVMSTRRATPETAGVAGEVAVHGVYAGTGEFAPALSENVRAATWLVARAYADIWHFVFAPNPRSSAVGRAARWLRRVPVVQTVASPPRRFAPAVFFGDVVVAQSRWTRARIEEAFQGAGVPPPRLAVVPPPLGAVPAPAEDAIRGARQSLGAPDGAPVLVYPGDLEVSRGAATVVRAIPAIRAAVPDVIVVLACRAKTPAASGIAASLARGLDASAVRFVGAVDLPALLAASTAVLFPVDDLFGKVDLPLSLLEAMHLGVPVVTLDAGPLTDLEGVLRVPAADSVALADAAIRVCRDPALRRHTGEAGRRYVVDAHAAARIAGEYEHLYDDLLEKRFGVNPEPSGCTIEDRE